jgi:hypothetical protein
MPVAYEDVHVRKPMLGRLDDGLRKNEPIGSYAHLGDQRI